jgi:hypothetical protein
VNIFFQYFILSPHPTSTLNPPSESRLDQQPFHPPPTRKSTTRINISNANYQAQLTNNTSPTNLSYKPVYPCRVPDLQSHPLRHLASLHRTPPPSHLLVLHPSPSSRLRLSAHTAICSYLTTPAHSCFNIISTSNLYTYVSRALALSEGRVGGVTHVVDNDRHNAAFLMLVMSLYEAGISGLGLVINFDSVDANA